MRERQAEFEADGGVGPDDFFDTDWEDLDGDDALLDAIAGGADPTMSSLLDQAVAETLTAERDRVHSREPREDTHPEAVIAERDRRDAEAAAKRSRENPNTTGGNPVPISNDAAQLGQMGEDGEAVVGQLAAVNGRIDDAVGTVDAIAIALDDAAAPAVAASDYVTTVAGTAQGLLGGAEGDQVAGLGNAAAAAINDVVAAVMANSAAVTAILQQLQSVEPVVRTAQEMTQQFFAELKAAAQRHGS